MTLHNFVQEFWSCRGNQFQAGKVGMIEKCVLQKVTDFSWLDEKGENKQVGYLIK